MLSQAGKNFSFLTLLACSLLNLTSCGGSAIHQAVGSRQVDPLQIVTTQTAKGIVGQNYSFQMQSSGGGPPFNWSIVLGGLPPGILLSGQTGLVAGMPTQAGNYSFTIEVTDSTFTGQQASMESLSIVISVPNLTITTLNLPDGIVGQSYSFQLQAWGGTLPYMWSIVGGSLAPGVQLDPLTGKITGTPTQAGTSMVTIQVTDSSSPQNIARLILGGADPGEPASSAIGKPET